MLPTARIRSLFDIGIKLLNFICRDVRSYRKAVLKDLLISKLLLWHHSSKCL